MAIKKDPEKYIDDVRKNITNKKLLKTLAIAGGVAVTAGVGYTAGKTAGTNEAVKERVTQRTTSIGRPAYEDYNTPLQGRVDALGEAVKEGNLRVEKEGRNLKYLDKKDRIVAEISAGAGKDKRFINFQYAGKNFSSSNVTFYVHNNPKVPVVLRGMIMELEAKDGAVREDTYFYHEKEIGGYGYEVMWEMKLRNNDRTVGSTNLYREGEIPQFKNGFEDEMRENIKIPRNYEYNHLEGPGIISTSLYNGQKGKGMGD